MKIYYVEREGIYLQGVFGMFDTKEKAIKAADIAKKGEKDDYHSFFVRSKNLNVCGYEDIDDIETFTGFY